MNQKNPLRNIAYSLADRLSEQQVHLLVVSEAVWAHYIYQCLKFWTGGNDQIYWFCDWETLPYDQYPPHPDLISERLRVLAELPTRKQGVVITTTSAIRQRLCPQTHLDAFGVHLTIGDRIEQNALIERLIAAGYRQNPCISAQGEYAHRGSIIDLYPMGAEDPIRLEWFDNEIESIRTFSLDTQLTLVRKNTVSILPSTELDLSDAGRVCFRQSARRELGEHFTASGIYRALSQSLTPQGLEYYLPLFFDTTATLFDYLPKNACYIPCGDLLPALNRHADYCAKRYERLDTLRENTLLSPEKLWLDPGKVLEKLSSLSEKPLAHRYQALDFHGTTAEREALWLNHLREAKQSVLHFPGNGIREHWFERLGKAGHPLRLAEVWQKNAASPETSLYLSPVHYSFIADGVVHLAEPDLHSTPNLPNYRINRSKEAGAVVRSLQDLTVGAPVVHIDHGVGRYRGLETFDDNEEMLVIEYADNNKLFVSVDDLDLISKYNALSGNEAPLHQIGGKAWQTLKRKAKAAIYDTASELLAISAARENAAGHALQFDHEALNQLAAGFAYEETADQTAAIAAVLGDLETPRPMDRVVCGDVGFGKTEVAIRAAYAAVLGGYQVALIAPTTLLAEQHERTFSDRLSACAVIIAAISRFKSGKEQQAVLDGLREGRIDIVIGTHRLLQKDVGFRKLGLIIVDEEQRFGVRHKEILKSLRAEVNLLTLTATPIPRTLNFALAGLRDLSIISTPPAGRQSIETIITGYDPATIEEACERELRRGGQVYFVHNEVASIERIARMLGELLPDVRIAVAHGQMHERALEEIMQAFYNRHYDILVVSTIIESGIDIANANTIIINHAEKLGLAQLHQLRGRVGRGHQQAYAYLITASWQLLNKDAQRRLGAFTSLDSLGAGFLLASQDLEIRGAGEFLGSQQSGQIQQIGMSYYLDLLERASAALKSGEKFSPDEDSQSRHTVELDMPALLPSSYVFDPQLRLVIYHRIARTKDENALDAIHIELIDRFGSLPETAENLFTKARLRFRAAQIGIEKLNLSKRKIDIIFSRDAAIDPDKLFQRIQKEPQRFKMIDPTSIRINQPGTTLSERIATLGALLDAVAAGENGK